MGRYGYQVLDGDGHVAEPEALWERYLDKPYQEIRPRIITDNRGVARYFIDGWLFTKPPGKGVGHPGGFIQVAGVSKYAGAYDPQARLKDMDLEGIDIAVLFATVTMGASAGVLPTPDPGFDVALCKAYNSWVADYCKADPSRLTFVAVLPTRAIPDAVKELTRCVEKLGAVGLELPTNSQGCFNPGDAYFYPIYEEAERLGVPIFTHPHAGGQIIYAGWERYDNFFHGHVIAFPFEQMMACLSVIADGVLERFPRLKFGFLESGVGWVPYWIERMDEHYEKLSHLVPNLKRLPSDWAKHPNVIFSCDPDEKMLPVAVEVLGQDRIMYASDYPHWDAKTPDSVKLLAERTDLSETVKKKILGENGARMYNLKLA
jgi:uncharacterized protein